MEPLFELKDRFSEEDYRIGCSYIWFWCPAKIISNILFILYVALLALIVSDLIFLYVAVLVIYYLWMYFMYRRSVKRGVLSIKELYGDTNELKSTVTFTDEVGRSVSEGHEDKMIRYDTIKRVVSLKKYILIHSKAGNVFVFGKDSFTLGTAEEFLAFLKSKGVKVR